MAKLIKANGVSQDDYPITNLKSMQDAVGGYIEPLYTSQVVILVNEEGLLQNLPLNIECSAMAGQPLVGDCLVLTHKEWASIN